MRITEVSTSWVVFEMMVPGRIKGVKAVCGQKEWEAIQSAQPGMHTLIQAGITSEAEAERYARYGPIDPNKRDY
jgi:hypothetical protein